MKYPELTIITGANGQTAIHIAHELLKQNCRLLLIAHKRTDRAEKHVADYPNLCKLIKCDLTDFETTHTLIQNYISEAGIIPDALVHTAAIRSYDAKTLADSEPETWNSIISQNITMAYNVIRNVLPAMIERRKGKIVLFGSNVTRTGLPYGSAYAAAKSALANLVRSVAWEIAQSNVQINMVSPAPIETNLEEDYSGDYLEFRKEYFEAYKKSHPSKKLISVDEVTQVVLSLLNCKLNAVSGEEIYITGGVL